MNVVRTHSAMRLGDQLAALHFLRAMAKKHPDVHFVHAGPLCYLQQMIEVTADLPNLQLRDILHSRNELSFNAWKNAGAFWETHPNRNDYAGFMLEFFDVLAKRLGFDESPLKVPSDLLFDYPALRDDRLQAAPFDVLVVNAAPMSSQWKAYDPVALTTLIQRLNQKNKIIITTPCGLPDIRCTSELPGFSVTNIGQLSQLCKVIVMVSTGPSWPTLNVWNVDTIDLRIVFLENEVLGLSKNTEQCTTVDEATRVLKFRGLI